MPCTGRVGKNRVQGLAYAVTFRGGNMGGRERGAGGGPSHVRWCTQPAPSRLAHGSPDPEKGRPHPLPIPLSTLHHPGITCMGVSSPSLRLGPVSSTSSAWCQQHCFKKYSRRKLTALTRAPL